MIPSRGSWMKEVNLIIDALRPVSRDELLVIGG